MDDVDLLHCEVVALLGRAFYSCKKTAFNYSCKTVFTPQEKIGSLHKKNKLTPQEYHTSSSPCDRLRPSASRIPNDILFLLP